MIRFQGESFAGFTEACASFHESSPEMVGVVFDLDLFCVTQLST